MSLPVTSFPVVVGVSPGSPRDSVTSSSAWSRDKDGSVGDVAELKKRVVFRYRSSAGPGTLVMTSQPGTINGRYERNVSTTLKSISTQNYFTDSEMRKADFKIIVIIIFDPGTQFPGNEKITLCSTEKVQKTSWNEPYSSSFTEQSCSKMTFYR